MRLLLALVITAATISAASAQYGSTYGTSNGSLYGTGSNPSNHSVGGYTNSHGTYVAPYQATNPNSTQMDNYSTRGNINPYTGAVGTRTPRW